MFQHHYGGPYRANRIGDAFARDIKGSFMNWLEHGRKAALRVNVARRGDSQAAGEGRCEVGENVGVQICSHNGVQARGLAHHASGHGVDQHLVARDTRELSCHLGRDLVPENYALALRVGFRDDRGSLKAKRMMRVAPLRVKIEVSVATSSGKPRWARPPWPAYSASVFSPTMAQSRSPGLQSRSGDDG